MMGKTHIFAKLSLTRNCVRQTVLALAKRFAQHKRSFSKLPATSQRGSSGEREHRSQEEREQGREIHPLTFSNQLLSLPHPLLLLAIQKPKIKSPNRLRVCLE
jgi:hypothetical protein